jgi:hypothetical protein
MGKATLDTRPLFEWVRRQAYTLHTLYDDYDSFEACLVDLAHEGVRGPFLNRTPVGETVDPLTDADLRKAELCAHKVAHWVWERFRPDEPQPTDEHS